MNRDIAAGLLFLAVGVTTLLLSRPYEVGTTFDMGPGYFPTAIGIILIALGLALGLAGLRTSGARLRLPALRPLLTVIGAVVAFGLLVERVGVVPATIAAVVLGSASSGQFRLWEVAALSVVLSGLVVGVFVLGLGLPFRVW
jgi:hypothetical protein